MKQNRSQLLFDCFLIVAVLLYVAIFALTPMCVDDYFYSFHSATLTSPFDKAAAIWQNCWDRWHYDTGRLCNLMAPVFLGLFPKIVFSVISGFFIWMSIRLMCRLADVRRGAVASWVILFLFTFALPWFEYMFTVIFALNYVWPAALALLFVYWMLNGSKVVERQSRGRFVFMCVVAFLSGWMHEGFSVPVIVGLIATWTLTRHHPAKRELALFICFAVGFLLIVVSPALWYRTTHMEPYLSYLSPLKQLFYGFVCNLLFFAFVILLGYLWLKHRINKLCDDSPGLKQLIIFIVFSSLAATVLFFKFYTGPRMAWFATVFCSVGLVAIGNKLLPTMRGLSQIITKSIFALLVIVNLSAAVVEQEKLYRESEDIVRLFLESPDGVVYYDNIPRRITPSLYKTSVRYFNMESQGLFSVYWRENDNVMLTLLPTALKGFAPSQATPCRSESSLYIIDGNLICRESVASGRPSIRIRTDATGWIATSMRSKTFTAADGSKWALIDPYISSLAGLRVTDAKWND